eukprot:1474192-Rhodomonas_salina.1
MGSGKGPVANAMKKHELACWDARIPSFTAHRDNMQQHMSSYKVLFILDAGRALFVKYNALCEPHKAAKTVFKDKIEDWTTEEEVKLLTAHFNNRESGK